MLDLDVKIQALNIFIYSKLWYAAHIIPFTKPFEKKVDKLTRTFLWGSPQKAPIGLHHLYPPKVAGGLGLQSVAIKAKHMWAKGFLDSVEVYFRSPALGRAFNMMASVSTESFNTNSLRMWMLKHKSLRIKTTCPHFWREAWRTLRLGKWSVRARELSRDNRAKIAAFKVFYRNTPHNLKKGRVSIEIAKTKYPVFLKDIEVDADTFPEIRKRRPRAERPRLFVDWSQEGRDVSTALREFNTDLNCRLVTAKHRVTTWKIMNRAFKTDTHSGDNYPHKGCAVCGNDTASVDHRYFLCPSSRKIWEEIYAAIGIVKPPTVDIFFCRILHKFPGQLRAILYHSALWAIHSARKAMVYRNKPLILHLAVLSFKSLVTSTLDRISKFSKLITGGKNQVKALLNKGSLIFKDPTSDRLAVSWNPTPSPLSG
ncbi:hypothetical protein DSO57_1025731 [Entomophthora muscae]|uniref:Uncharacterized protein n=1 Tax=Entomophthora muscae TaxID=34485 RepID=A0ACC2UM40_9FUNG|nr:hypothetical protein DSO57_1025731 [Entomophthora muscae]